MNNVTANYNCGEIYFTTELGKRIFCINCNFCPCVFHSLDSFSGHMFYQHCDILNSPATQEKKVKFCGIEKSTEIDKDCLPAIPQQSVIKENITTASVDKIPEKNNDDGDEHKEANTINDLQDDASSIQSQDTLEATFEECEDENQTTNEETSNGESEESEEAEEENSENEQSDEEEEEQEQEDNIVLTSQDSHSHDSDSPEETKVESKVTKKKKTVCSSSQSLSSDDDSAIENFVQNTYLKKTKRRKHFTKKKNMCKGELLPNHIHGFIEIYKKFECLWNTEHMDFRFKNKRLMALETMKTKVEEDLELAMNMPSLQIEIQKLRRNYREEKRWHIFRSPRTMKSQKTEFEYFAELSFLDAHVGPFMCKSCGDVIESHDDYRVHVAGHEGILPFGCCVCHKRFMLISSYVEHMRRHTNNFPFKCTICDQKYASSLKLEIHKRLHIKQRQFKCTECHQAFFLLKDLCKHSETHHFRPCYPCSLCMKSYFSRKELRAHMKKCHVD